MAEPKSESIDAGGADALAHLARMSGTGSAFGAADYVALNPMAIAAVVLGIASALSIIIELFLFVPVLGVICGLIALRQIRNSSGTQTGSAFALGGIILSLGIGGFVTGREALAWSHAKADSRQCAQVLVTFGEEIKAQHYDQIYANLMTESFRSSVDPVRFKNVLQVIRNHPIYGNLLSVYNNGKAIDFTPILGTDAKFGYTMMLLDCDRAKEPLRMTVRMNDRDGAWKIDEIAHLFPDLKKKNLGFGGG